MEIESQELKDVVGTFIERHSYSDTFHLLDNLPDKLLAVFSMFLSTSDFDDADNLIVMFKSSEDLLQTFQLAFI